MTEAPTAPDNIVPEEVAGDDAMGGGYPSSSRPFSALPSGTLEETVFHIEGFPENFPGIGKKSADLAKQLTKEEIAALFSKLKSHIWTRSAASGRLPKKRCWQRLSANPVLVWATAALASSTRAAPPPQLLLRLAAIRQQGAGQVLALPEDGHRGGHGRRTEDDKAAASVDIGSWAQPPPRPTDQTELGFADYSLAHTVASQVQFASKEAGDCPA